MLRVADLSKNYGDVVALDGCTFEAPRGTLLGFLGPNGAGKTTAMRSVFGLVRPDTGTVTWEGAPIDAATRLRFGYMPEQRGLYPKMRITDQLVYFARLHGLGRDEAHEAAARWLDTLGLTDRAGDRLEDLSHGNQQRVQLAAALVHDPELLVLDEPFSGLDPFGVQSMAEILAARAAAGTAVVFSSHQLDLVDDICESVVVIHRGHVVLSGPVTDLRTSSPYRYLDIRVVGATDGWWGSINGSDLLKADSERVQLRVPVDADASEMLALAEAAGDVQEFTFSPPSLSQVFREAVGQ
jgi:ABC-2 type transport system ATP-binding protein